MSYLVPKTLVSVFSAYNSTAQNESATSYDLDFNTARNITKTGTSTLYFEYNSFMWADCRSVKDGADTDERHSFNLSFNSTSLSDKASSIEASGRTGIYNQNLGGDIAYGVNKTGATVSSTIRCTFLYNDYDQTANFNRLVGFRF
jgi:hypothetical protein